MFREGIKVVGALIVFLFVLIQGAFGQYHFIRSPLNPVMPVGPSSWDGVHTMDPNVLFRNGTYHMWYSGWGGYGQEAIGYATSADGAHWTKHAGNPVLTGNVVPWTLGGVRNAAVTWVDDLDEYAMLFNMYPCEPCLQKRVGLATSSDGIIWTACEDPVLACGEPGSWDMKRIGYCSPIIFFLGRYWTWYAGLGPHSWAIGAATSSDLIHWTKYANNPVLIRGLPNDWDGENVCHPEVYIRGGKLEMWYSGWPNFTQSNSAFGLAFSDDGIHWQKYDDNPVFATGNLGQWDDRYVSSPTVVYEPDSVKLWYAAYSFTSPWSGQWNTGYAISAYPMADDDERWCEASTTVDPHLKVRGPNPFTNSVEIEFLAFQGDLSLAVYNVLGQKIRDLSVDSPALSQSAVLWNGKNDEGRTVADGVYFIRLVADGKAATAKVLKISS